MLTDLIIKKMKRGLAPEQIADMLEINLAIGKEICNVAKDYAPDYDVKKISEVYQKECLLSRHYRLQLSNEHLFLLPLTP